MHLHDKCRRMTEILPDLKLPPAPLSLSLSLFPPWFPAFIKNNCAKNHTSWNLCFVDFNITFYVLEFEIGILVLNTCIDTQHIILFINVSRWYRSAGTVYPETLCIREKSPSWPFPKLVMYVDASPSFSIFSLYACLHTQQHAQSGFLQPFLSQIWVKCKSLNSSRRVVYFDTKLRRL